MNRVTNSDKFCSHEKLKCVFINSLQFPVTLLMSIYSDLEIRLLSTPNGSLLMSTGVVWACHPILKGVIMPV